MGELLLYGRAEALGHLSQTYSPIQFNPVHFGEGGV